MLQYSAAIPATLELLKLLMQQKSFNDFNLAGGTSLSLQLGHRLSIHLDLFASDDFEPSVIIDELQKILKFDIVQNKINSLILNVEYPGNSNSFVKVDILKYSYKLIDNIIELDGIRLLSIKDIIPMKLSAIANRGAKKDFYDIYFLLNNLTLKEMLELFSIKFPNVNHFHILKSLEYFEDTEVEANPKVFKKVTWEQIKMKIGKLVNEYL